eukprot:TRINITY_DN2646_c0_g4_i1.p1 TRINITY_DN2646_c0_g4~~TRINITY_DN2646_c0_g4_i1.p1  ORF type:complete len:172 (+),score=7.64 TRINITY_DN2646_c0_g4_i1:147-662(+)
MSTKYLKNNKKNDLRIWSRSRERKRKRKNISIKQDGEYYFELCRPFEQSVSAVDSSLRHQAHLSREGRAGSLEWVPAVPSPPSSIFMFIALYIASLSLRRRILKTSDCVDKSFHSLPPSVQPLDQSNHQFISCLFWLLIFFYAPIVQTYFTSFIFAFKLFGITIFTQYQSH